MTEVDLLRVDDAEELAGLGAEWVLSSLGEAITQRDRARCVLAGGTTPLRLYRLLASRPEALDWSRVEFFWGDERCVPASDAESNYAAAREALLDPLGIDPQRCARIRGELTPGQAAAEYDAVVEAALVGGDWDVVLLGLGPDGHTASLFPPRRPELEGAGWAVATRAPGPPAARVSLTLQALNRARRVLFLVTGAEKAAALARVRSGDPALHASAVAPLEGSVTWCVDRGAAGELSPAVQSG